MYCLFVTFGFVLSVAVPSIAHMVQYRTCYTTQSQLFVFTKSGLLGILMAMLKRKQLILSYFALSL